MIISCNNCDKKFDINSELIPEKGRLLECGSCGHQWFFKNEINNSPDIFKTENIKIENDIPKKEIIKNKKSIDLENSPGDVSVEGDKIKSETTKKDYKKKAKNYKILNIILIFIITFVTLVILVDTFKNPISKIVPNIEFMLYNLYESIKDIKLFFNDLI